MYFERYLKIFLVIIKILYIYLNTQTCVIKICHFMFIYFQLYVNWNRKSHRPQLEESQ